MKRKVWYIRHNTITIASVQTDFNFFRGSFFELEETMKRNILIHMYGVSFINSTFSQCKFDVRNKLQQKLDSQNQETRLTDK